MSRLHPLPRHKILEIANKTTHFAIEITLFCRSFTRLLPYRQKMCGEIPHQSLGRKNRTRSRLKMRMTMRMTMRMIPRCPGPRSGKH